MLTPRITLFQWCVPIVIEVRIINPTAVTNGHFDYWHRSWNFFHAIASIASNVPVGDLSHSA